MFSFWVGLVVSVVLGLVWFLSVALLGWVIL